MNERQGLVGAEPGSGVSRRTLVTWYAALVAGALPALLIGFLASALANKIAFAGWGLGLAVVHALVLRWGLQSRWSGWVLGGRLLLLFAAGAAIWLRLAMRHGEELDLGFRAVAPALYDPALAEPRSAVVATVALGIAGALAILIGHGAERLRRPAR